MKSVDRILGEAMTPQQKRIYKDIGKLESWDEDGKVYLSGAEKALNWAIKHGQRFPEAEPYIAKTWGFWTYKYARDVVKERWPEGEANILRNPEYAFYYARDVIKGRWPEVEATIAKCPYFKSDYLKEFPEAADDWALNGWIDWLDT